MKKQIDPAVSKFFSDMAKKRKNPYKFNSDTGKKAGAIGREKQRIKKQEASKSEDSAHN